MEQRLFKIDQWQVNPAEGVISRNKETIHLEPKVMEVLVYLVDHAGEVVTREQLERDIWLGAIVGYDSITATILKLRKALNDDPKQVRCIATIPKRGYQLIAPVQYLDEATPPAPKSNTKSNLSYLFVALFATVLVVVSGLTYFLNTSGTTEKPTILVLPFKNLGGGDQLSEFADGFTEDIVTDLSQVSNMTVFASSTTFRFHGRKIELDKIKSELGADFVIQGSLQRQNNQIRVNVQLVDTETELNQWAESFARKTNEVFAVQSEIINGVFQALSIKTSDEENKRLAQRATRNLKAYDFFLEGQSLSRIYSKKTNEQARVAFHQAIKTDPGYGRAYGAMAFTLAVDFLRGWSDAPTETLDRALSLAEQAVALSDAIPQTYWALGFVHFVRKEPERAEAAIQKSIKITPNYADSYGLLALIYNFSARPELALDNINHAMKLNPYYSWDYLYNKAMAYYHLGQYETAIPLLEQAAERNENVIPIKLMLAAVYVNVNRQDDASWVIEQVQVLNPATTLEHVKKSTPIVDAKSLEKYLADLRNAGLPE